MAVSGIEEGLFNEGLFNEGLIILKRYETP